MAFSCIHPYFITIWPYNVCFFHFTISNKTPTTSQHTRGILPIEGEVQGTPCCCQWETEQPRQGFLLRSTLTRVLLLYAVCRSCLCSVSIIVGNLKDSCFSSWLLLTWEKTLLCITAWTGNFSRELKRALWVGVKSQVNCRFHLGCILLC